MVTSDYEQLVAQRNPWIAHNFPDTDPAETYVGVVEELGELAHAHLKQRQSIRGSHEEHIANGKDAIGDMIVYLLGCMNEAGMPRVFSAHPFQPQDELDNDFIFRLAIAVGGLVGRKSVYDIEQVIRYCEEYCHMRGWDYEAIVRETWAEVSKRDWIKFPGDGLTH